MCSVSVANNFHQSQTASGYGYHSFGELACFVYCLLQKTKQGSLLPLVELVLLFQVFQPTAPIVREPEACGKPLIINLERVMICENDVRGALLCVQDFVRSPHFTQRNLFSESGVAMLVESAAICYSIRSSAVFEPWSHVETASCSQVVGKVCACMIQAVDRRRAVKDSQEQWYAVDGIKPSSEDLRSRSGVRISNVVEEGWVENVSVIVSLLVLLAPAVCVFLQRSPGRGKLVEALLKDAWKLQVPLHHLNAIV